MTEFSHLEVHVGSKSRSNCVHCYKTYTATTQTCKLWCQSVREPRDLQGVTRKQPRQKLQFLKRKPCTAGCQLATSYFITERFCLLNTMCAF